MSVAVQVAEAVVAAVVTMMTKMMTVVVQVVEAVVAVVMMMTMKMMTVVVQVAEAVVAAVVMMMTTTMTAVVVQMGVVRTLVIKNAMLMDALRLKQTVFENKGGIMPPLFLLF